MSYKIRSVVKPNLSRQFRLFLSLFVSCAAFVPSIGHTQSAPAPHNAAPSKNTKRTHTIKAKDYFSLSYLGGFSVSPDGSLIAYTESRWEKGAKGRNTDLWLINTKNLQKQRLTFNRASDRNPQWSPDGRWIYFLSRRTAQKGEPHLGKTQVWRIRPSGDRLMAVTRSTKSIHTFQLSHDGQQIYYKTTHRRVQKGPFDGLRKKFSSIQYGHGVIQSGQLWALDLQSWRTRQLLNSKRVIGDFEVSPDNKKIALLTTPDNHLVSNEGWSRVEIYDIATKKTTLPDSTLWRKKAPSPYGWLDSIRWAPDSKQLSFGIGFDGYPGEVFVLGLQNNKITSTLKLKRHNEAHYEGGMRWQPGTGRFCYIATRDALNRLYCTAVSNGKQGKIEIITAGDQNTERFGFSGDGKHLALAFSGKDFPIDLFFAKTTAAQKTFKRLTRINPQVDTWKIPSIQKVQWKSKDGTPVEGVLELPPGAKPGKPLPLVVILHGGPTWSVKQRFRFFYLGRTLLASKGWATLSPNYRGSTGYGDKFMTDLIGHKNDRDIADILSGVDHLIAKGIVDPKRMAIMGWSNGGYLVNCLITQTQRFKAASSGAGVFDTAMQWMIEDTPGHVINYNRGFPWTRSKAMQKSSPLYGMHKVTTPTIIHVGELDPRVPVQHSRGLYRALKRYLKVPTQLLVYPKTFHGLHQRKHRLAKITWDIKWFNHFVLGKTKKKTPKTPPTKKAK